MVVFEYASKLRPVGACVVGAESCSNTPASVTYLSLRYVCVEGFHINCNQ